MRQSLRAKTGVYAAAEMYSAVVSWLRDSLKHRYKGAMVDVQDTHRYCLNDYISQYQAQHFTSLIYRTYEFRSDITAFVRSEKVNGLVLIACKTVPISLTHVCQFVGYMHVARPLLCFLLSPIGISDHVRSLVLTYDRTDVLEYHREPGKQPLLMKLARFDPVSKQLDLSSILPPGAVF